MKRKSDEYLIREYINQVIKSQVNENDGGMGFGDYTFDSSMMGMGGGYGGGGDVGSGLYKALIKPFTDVAGVAMGKAKELSRTLVTNLQIIFETIMTTFIPFLEDSYDEIFASQKADVQKIRSEYGKYYQATEEALRGPGATALAFMAFPTAAIFTRAVDDGPKAVKGILSVATGGVSDKYLGGGGGGGGPRSSGMFDSYVRDHSLKFLVEDDEKKSAKKDDKDKVNPLVKKLRNPEFVDSIKNSDTIQGASERAKEIYRKTLNDTFKFAQMVQNAKSLEDIEKLENQTDEKIEKKSELAKVKSELGKFKTKEEKDNAVKGSLSAVKQASKEKAIARLEKEVKPVREKFGDDFPFVKDYDATIQKIKSL